MNASVYSTKGRVALEEKTSDAQKDTVSGSKTLHKQH